jgi:geranylgeranyl diphosphate synthase, type I
MNGSIAKAYLKNYIISTDTLYLDFFKDKVKEAYELGAIPGELTESFCEMGRVGKRFRGALMVLAFELFRNDKDSSDIIPTSLLMELLHAGLLIQDDIMDNDPIRRGFQTLHTKFEQRGRELEVKASPKLFGTSVAMCIADAGFYWSWEVLMKSSFSAESKVAAANILNHYLVRLIHGQALDVAITGAKDLSEKDILNVIWTKSGEYTTLLPMLLGASLAGITDENKLAVITEYAKCLGWAFQIQDDILGMFGEQEEMGKPVGSDLREGKNTLLILHLSKRATPEQLTFMKEKLGNPDITQTDVEAMKQILKDSGAYEYVLNLGWSYVEQGKTLIPKLTTDARLQELLESFLVLMMERTK